MVRRSQSLAHVSDCSQSSCCPTDLQLSLEESSSVTEDSDTLRQDLIFLPSLDPVRDEALLKARTLPEYLQDEIRFDRGLSIKFLERLGRGLKK